MIITWGVMAAQMDMGCAAILVNRDLRYTVENCPDLIFDNAKTISSILGKVQSSFIIAKDYQLGVRGIRTGGGVGWSVRKRKSYIRSTAIFFSF